MTVSFAVAMIVVCVIVSVVAVRQSMIVFVIGHTVGSYRHEMLEYAAAVRACLSHPRG